MNLFFTNFSYFFFFFVLKEFALPSAVDSESDDGMMHFRWRDCRHFLLHLKNFFLLSALRKMEYLYKKS